jgi:chromosome segregation ATPase
MKATDPRRRLERASPSILQNATSSPRDSDGQVLSTSKTTQVTTTATLTVSTPASPAETQDIAMSDDAVPTKGTSDVLSAFLDVVQASVSVGIHEIQKNKSRLQREEAEKEHRKARDSHNANPILVEHIASTRKAADQDYKSASKKVSKSVQSRDAKLPALSKALTDHAEKLFSSSLSDVDTIKVMKEDFATLKHKIGKLEQGSQPQSVAGPTDDSIQSLDTRITHLEDKAKAAQTAAARQADANSSLKNDIKRLAEDPRVTPDDFNTFKTTTLDAVSQLQASSKMVLKTLGDHKSEIANFRKAIGDQDQLDKVLGDHWSEIINLRKNYGDHKSEIMNLRKCYSEQTELKKLVTKLEADDIGKLRKNDEHLWTEVDRTWSELIHLKEDSQKSSGDWVSRSEFDALRAELNEMKKSFGQGRLVTPSTYQGSRASSEVPAIVETPKSPLSSKDIDQKSELKVAIERIQTLEKDVLELNNELKQHRVQQDTSTSSNHSIMDYVKRYEQDKSELSHRVDTLESHFNAHKSESAAQLSKHITDNIDKVQSLSERMDGIGVETSDIRTEIASLHKANTPAQSPAAKPDTELRARVEASDNRLFQLSGQINVLSQQMQARPIATRQTSNPGREQEIEKKLKVLQEMVDPVAKEFVMVKNSIASTEHSIRSLTTRYNNINTDHMVKKMAHHLNTIPAALKEEQAILKTRVESFDASLTAAKESITAMRDSITEQNSIAGSQKTNQDDFESRLKSQYYDVLETKTVAARKDIEIKLQEMAKRQQAIESAIDLLGAKVESLQDEKEERHLQAFQKPVQPRPPSRGTISSRDGSQSRSVSSVPLAERVERPKAFQPPPKRRRVDDDDEVSDSITASQSRRSVSSRKKTQQGR